MLQDIRRKPSWHKPITILVHIFPFTLPIENILTPVDSVSEVLPCEDDVDYSPPESFPSQQQHNPPASVESVGADADQQQPQPVLELAAMGDIQLFMRPTEDGGYEPVESSEARDLIAQNSCNVKFYGADEAQAIVNGDLSYLAAALSTTSAAEVQNQQPANIIVPDSNGIMVLDPNNDQKALTLGDLEILENAELRQLLFKSSEDKYGSEVEPSYLNQSRIDEILSVKSITNEGFASAMDQSNYTTGMIFRF